MARKRRVATPIKRLKDVEDIIPDANEEIPEDVTVIGKDGKTPEPKPGAEKPNFKEYLNVFRFETVLPGTGEKVSYKPLTIGQLKNLLTYDVADKTVEELDPETLTAMFDDIILNSAPDIDVLELYTQDRYHILLEIRKKTKGETEQYQIICPKCGNQSIQNINFENISVMMRPDKIQNKVKLTDELSITLHHLKRKDEIEIFGIWRELITEDMNEAQKKSELAILTEAATIEDIITPNGKEDASILDKKYLLENIPQPLYQNIQDWHDKNNFGPEMKLEVKCPHPNCKHKAVQDITAMDFFS